MDRHMVLHWLPCQGECNAGKVSTSLLPRPEVAGDLLGSGAGRRCFTSRSIQRLLRRVGWYKTTIKWVDLSSFDSVANSASNRPLRPLVPRHVRWSWRPRFRRAPRAHLDRTRKYKKSGISFSVFISEIKLPKSFFYLCSMRRGGLFSFPCW